MLPDLASPTTQVANFVVSTSCFPQRAVRGSGILLGQDATAPSQLAVDQIAAGSLDAVPSPVPIDALLAAHRVGQPAGSP